jgi:hypothetical protein
MRPSAEKKLVIMATNREANNTNVTCFRTASIDSADVSLWAGAAVNEGSEPLNCRTA